MRKYFSLFLLASLSLACALPAGLAAPEPLATFDPNSMQTAIVETAIAAQTQTALDLPTSTVTPTPSRIPSVTPTFTPTFIYKLPTFTPPPTYTPIPTIATLSTKSTSNSDDEEKGGKPKRDPKAITDLEWSCSLLGTSPRRDLTFNPGTRFTVQWQVYNNGTKDWPYYGVDLVFTAGFKDVGYKIWDFNRSVPSGGEIMLSATFVAPERPGSYNSFYMLQVGRRQFCQVTYAFVVEK